MLCLVCEKKIPLHRQLAGSPFCSREHSEQHNTKKSRPDKEPNEGPLPAKFAPSSPAACALPDAQPDATAFRTPISRFCDVILCRRNLKPRYTVGVPSARAIGWVPDRAPPGITSPIDVGLQCWNRLHLGTEVSNELSVARRLSSAVSKQGAEAIHAGPERLRSMDAGLRTMPWDASFRTRWPTAHLAPARLLVAHPFPPVLALSNAIHRDGACGAPIPFPLTPASAPFTNGLPTPTLLANQTGFPPLLKPGSVYASPLASATAAPIGPRQRLELGAAVLTSPQGVLPPLAGYSGEALPSANSPSPSAAPGLSLNAGVLSPKLPVPQIGLVHGLEGGTGLQALSGIGESFTLADMEPALRAAGPIAAGPTLALPEPSLRAVVAPSLRAPLAQAPDLRGRGGKPAAQSEPPSFQYILQIPGDVGKPDRGDLEGEQFVCSLAGWAMEELPSPIFGIFRPLYDSCDFSLRPVWLASLFALGHPFGGPRLCAARSPKAMGSPGRFNRAAAHDSGPGFSGVLMLPQSGAPAWEFEQLPPVASRPEDARDRPAANSPWQEALRFWRSVPGFARGLAVAIPLVAPAIFYAPTISAPHLSIDQDTMTAIQARAMIDLREDFQSGLGAWSGAKGWENTWQMDSPGAAQPGRMALYRPMTRLTDYRLELQGQIQSKALGFVFRATDMNNYYAIKIAIRKPGPLPSVYLVRYAVIEGRPGPKTETLLPMYLRSDTLYDVLVTVRGENFTITVNDQLVDNWSDGRLKSGGVGLFAEKGEISQVRSVHVTENDDFLGRICSQVSHWNADRIGIGVKHE